LSSISFLLISNPLTVSFGLLISIDTCPFFRGFLASLAWSYIVLGSNGFPVLPFYGRNFSFYLGNFGILNPWLYSIPLINAESYTCWYFAFCLFEHALMLWVRNFWVSFVGFTFPLPYAWKAGFPKYVVNAESASHLVVAFISAVLTFSALS